MEIQIQKTKCDLCSKPVLNFQMVCLVLKTERRNLCSKCYNEYIAENLELNFEHLEFDPITVNDKDGVPHTFNFNTRLFGENVCIEAFEAKEDGEEGYQFSIAGNAEDDLLALFGKLFEKLRRGLSYKHIEPCEINKYGITSDDIVRGNITWDENTDGESPCLIIDGKKFSWHEFGKMLTSYEGFNFKLEIFDVLDEC